MLRELDEITVRTIQKKDNAAIASIIRNTLTEFGANHPGTVYFDESTDYLFQVFQQSPHAVYYVAEYKNEIVGGAGIFPTPGLPDGTCELVKMYLIPQVRGIGLGRLLIQKCIETAVELGFHSIYLETMPELKKALSTYEKFGFIYLDKQLGNSGHFGCDLWMLKKL